MDGTGVADASSRVSFLDHMPYALLQALGDRNGINRFGNFSAPLDEALVHVSMRVWTYDIQVVHVYFITSWFSFKFCTYSFSLLS
ncbi:imidazoleglycerol-phosphate dehydratase [Medicago truncatula]|uniref:Imidazoleglycerol-phosphate dehydratase n=1 Tax=Medicago truncatula TaxID=3880 RepID=G7IDJ6_MEDTR|nr:imidazoleglycerol-phosphate dehydratase [Medicago truncatula]